jgi:hypothetical protein
LKTNDGGLNWVIVDTTVAAPLLSVCFASKSTGYAVGHPGGIGVLLKSTDGGNHWSEQQVGNGVRGHYPAGYSHFIYDAGHNLSSGIYFIQAEVEGKRFAARMVIGH